MQLGLVQLQEENGKFTTFCWVKQACMMLACGRCNSVAWSLVMFPLGLFVKRQESGRQQSADVNESASFHRTDSNLDFLSSSVWSSCIASEFTWSCRRWSSTLGRGKGRDQSYYWVLAMMAFHGWLLIWSPWIAFSKDWYTAAHKEWVRRRGPSATWASFPKSSNL